MTALPRWMYPRTTPDDWRRPPEMPEVAHTPRRNLVRRALGNFSGLLGTLLDADTAVRPGVLQGIDARAKVLGLIGLIVVLTCVHRLPALALGIGVAVILAALSQLPLRRLLSAWLTVPLFSAAIALPATLNIVTHGTPLWVIGHFNGTALAVTDAGLLVAGRFMLRATACVFFALLLTATTRPARLFRGLRLLGIPRIFVMLLSMMERYLGIVLRAAEEIHLAKLSRSILSGSVRQEQAWVAAGIGALFRRTHTLSEHVYLAMISRGYTGEVYLLEEPRWRRRDWVFLAGMLAVGVMLVLIG